jgi:hypothetical protein
MTKYCENKIRRLCFYGDVSKHRPCSVLRHAKFVEKSLNKICKKVWEFTNPKGEQFLFSKYVNPNDKSDTTIVTLGAHNRSCMAKYIHIG